MTEGCLVVAAEGAVGAGATAEEAAVGTVVVA